MSSEWTKVLDTATQQIGKLEKSQSKPTADLILNFTQE